MASNISADLIWEITRGNSSTLVKRKQAGGQQFSRDRFNLKNRYSRKNEGLVNNKAIGIHAGQDGGIVLHTKKADAQHTPASHIEEQSFSGSHSTRSSYKDIVDKTAKKDYRPDLRADAVARASAIRKSQRPVRESPASKPRGAKAKAAATSA